MRITVDRSLASRSFPSGKGLAARIHACATAAFIYIPELSPKDIENYLMLLVAQEYCTADDFKKIIDDLRSKEIRISEEVIDQEKLNELVQNSIPSRKQASFNETVQIITGIKGIIADNLKGNPRQAKRFLNTFTTKRKLAELYYGKGKIDNRVLAKLLVLQKLSPALFIELNEWNKRFTTVNEEYLQMRKAVSDDGDASVPDDRFNAWRVPSIVKWIYQGKVLSVRGYVFVVSVIENDIGAHLSDGSEQKKMQRQFCL